MMHTDWHDCYVYGRDRHGALLAQAEERRQERRARPAAARERLAVALIALGQRLASRGQGKASQPRLCGACGAPLPGFGAGRREEARC